MADTQSIIQGLGDRFRRHIVALYVEFHKGGEQPCPRYFTAFVLSVRGHWILFTAGHCLTEIDNRKSAGWVIALSRLIDTVTPDSPYVHGLPFDIEESMYFRPFDGDLNDYGVLYLREFYTRGLISNGVVPMDERVWQNDPESVDFYYVAGLPEHASVVNTETAQFKTIVARVEEVLEAPEGVENGELRWFAEVVSRDMVPSLSGVSGGPIFAVTVFSGTAKYYLHAVQSGQIYSAAGNLFLTANLARPIVRFLAEVADGAHPKLLDL